MSAQNAGDVYLVWSNEHCGWWGPDARGYSSNLALAGRYTREAALLICRAAIPTALHIGVVAELPVRESDVQAFLQGQMVPEAINRTMS